ncbi:MAG: alpha/beta fold hydrolase, partial [Novosphingobium sp.]
MTDIARFTLPSGQQMAYRHLPPAASIAAPIPVPTPGPTPGATIVFLPGYMSDMAGGKAQAVLEWAREQGHGCLLLDYTGCGMSDGDFADGRLSKWRDEAVALIDHLGIDKVALVGSSMGGWLMLLIAEALGNRAVALLGIAPAPDFTDWGLSQSQRIELAAGRTIHEDNPYGPEPTPTYAGFFSDAEKHKRLRGEIPFDGPVRLIHGQADADVPWQYALETQKQLR